MEKFKFFLKSFIGLNLFIVAMFISAGRIDYFQGWIYIAINSLGLIIDYIMSDNNNDLMKERSKPGENAKKWDKLIVGFSALLSLVMFIVAGLDSGRFYWSPHFQWYIYLLGIIITLIGQILFLTAKKQNNFFSSVARIQDERNHSVCDTGLYKTIRHPGYLGMIISLLGFPLVTGSLSSIIPSIISIILLLLRTQLEDKMLINELMGYDEYTKKTPYRLIPQIW